MLPNTLYHNDKILYSQSHQRCEITCFIVIFNTYQLMVTTQKAKWDEAVFSVLNQECTYVYWSLFWHDLDITNKLDNTITVKLRTIDKHELWMRSVQKWASTLSYGRSRNHDSSPPIKTESYLVHVTTYFYWIWLALKVYILIKMHVLNCNHP